MTTRLANFKATNGKGEEVYIRATPVINQGGKNVCKKNNR
jgi:hypothetical protein